jgi:hypothetical protein
LKKPFIILAALAHTTLTAVAQQRQGMEEIIKDTITLRQYKQSIPGLKTAGKSAELARTYKRIADYYYKNWYSDSLAFYYKQALQQYEKVQDSFHIAYCYSRIGEELAYSGKDPDASLSWHKPAAAYFEGAGEYIMAAHSNYAISSIYKSKGEPELRDQYLNKAKAYNKLGKDTLLDIIILETHADELRKEGRWNEAHAETLKGVELSRKIGQRLFLKVGLLQLGQDFLHFNQVEKAIQALEESIRITAITRNALPEAYRLLTICHIRLNNSSEAEKYLSLYKNSADSIAERRERDNYDEVLVQFETEKKQAIIASLQQDNLLKETRARNQKIFIAALAVGLVILLIAAWIVVRNIRKRQGVEEKLHKQQEQFGRQLSAEKEQKMMAEFNKQLAEVQLTALSAQMNPHFIFNCMNSIQKYILKNEKAKALEFLQNFSELMRLVLDNSTRTKTGLDEEIIMLEKYIQLEQQRLEYRFDYRIEVTGDLQTDFFEIPAMIIQPYVENAIWHGLMNLPDDANSRKGLLKLLFSKDEDQLRCVVEDNGVGRTKAAELEQFRSPGRKSYGMAISQKRLELLKKENENIPSVTIGDMYGNNNEPTGTRVIIHITIH